MNARPVNRLLFTAFGICAVALPFAGAQRAPTRAAAPLVGCWHLEPSPFVVVGRSPADQGQTVLPSLISLDTVPGTNWDNQPIGRRVRSLRDTTVTRYHEGYYRVGASDSVFVDWTNSVVGMSLALRRVDGLTMHGRATAWTDYGGTEAADITLRRAACASR